MVLSGLCFLCRWYCISTGAAFRVRSIGILPRLYVLCSHLRLGYSAGGCLIWREILLCLGGYPNCQRSKAREQKPLKTEKYCLRFNFFLVGKLYPKTQGKQRKTPCVPSAWLCVAFYALGIYGYTPKTCAHCSRFVLALWGIVQKQINRPLLGGSVALYAVLTCGRLSILPINRKPSAWLCAPSFGLALSGYSPIIAGAVPGLCGGCAGAVRRHGGAGKGQKKSRPRRGGSGLTYSFSKALRKVRRGTKSNTATKTFNSPPFLRLRS